MNECIFEHRPPFPLKITTLVKYLTLIGCSQLVAVGLFYCVAETSAATASFTSVLEMSFLTILASFFLRSGVITALVVACMLLTLISFAFVGRLTRRHGLSLFATLSSITLGLLLYFPTAGGALFPHALEMPPISLGVLLLFAVPLAVAICGRLIHKH
ncbi:hypothetical protein SC377_07685 [Actinotignum sp. SLA_B059]|uniref:hypothetical protein n=1 Tax=Actinotignum sp. SLA_B059 TaxID=3083287 RepID=UPI002A7F7236|nr:hypothetical protein [Actinotignum sp. SLA_B059]MDY5128020.1 hypothetical protein [Actinotignum sp. SLA_B059]